MMNRFIEGGRIVNTHGVRGQVKIDPWTDSPEFLGKIKTLYIDGRPVTVESARADKAMLIAKLEGVDDINAAMTLKDRVVSFDRADAPLRRGAFFAGDLMGARCVDPEGAEIGAVTEIIDAPAGLVFVVSGRSEHMVPNVPEFVLSADPERGEMVLSLIEGM